MTSKPEPKPRAVTRPIWQTANKIDLSIIVGLHSKERKEEKET